VVINADDWSHAIVSPGAVLASGIHVAVRLDGEMCVHFWPTNSLDRDKRSVSLTITPNPHPSCSQARDLTAWGKSCVRSVFVEGPEIARSGRLLVLVRLRGDRAQAVPAGKERPCPGRQSS
jgi:hypothetical protein